MASVAVKEAVAHRTLATELRQGAWGPTPLYLVALAVLYATAADQVSREVKYLAAKPVIAQEARSQGKIKTGKVDEGSVASLDGPPERSVCSNGGPPGTQGCPAH